MDLTLVVPTLNAGRLQVPPAALDDHTLRCRDRRHRRLRGLLVRSAGCKNERLATIVSPAVRVEKRTSSD